MSHIIDESRRCLQCKTPRCRPGCPVETDIPRMIDLFLNSRIDEAGAMLFENNPLSVITSLVCDHANQCEGHCILQSKGRGIAIGAIEHYISERYLERFTPSVAPRNGMRAAVIGSGPAGLTISVILARRGYEITIFDVKDGIGGVLRYGIPEFRLPKRILDRYQDLLKRLGVRLRPNTTIGRAITIDDLFRDDYLSIFVGTGTWRPSVMKIKGESLGNVHFAIDYLNSPKAFDLGETVSVIGAGNAAMDVARTALRGGAHVLTVYSRREALSASPSEVELARIDGVRFRHNVLPVEITTAGVIFRELVDGGRGKLCEVPGSDCLYPSDSVIIAVGQGPKSTLANTTKGLERNSKGLLVINEQGETTKPGVFASGDVVSGARTVVEAVRYSKGVADAMDEYMRRLCGRAV